MKNIETWRTLLFVADAGTRRTEFITAFTQPLLKPSLRVPRRPNLARNADCRGCGGVEFDDAPFVVFVLFCFCFPKWICFYYLKKKTAAEFFSRIACVPNDRARPLLALLDARVHARTVFGYSHIPCPPCPLWSRWPLVSR